MYDSSLSIKSGFQRLGEAAELCPDLQRRYEQDVQNIRGIPDATEIHLGIRALLHNELDYSHGRSFDFADLCHEALVNAADHGSDWCRIGPVLFRLWYSRKAVMAIISNPSERFLDEKEIPEWLEQGRLTPTSRYSLEKRGVGGESMYLYKTVSVAFEKTRKWFHVVLLMQKRNAAGKSKGQGRR
jgi:hypothetical protein